jgi:hypothetical protein
MNNRSQLKEILLLGLLLLLKLNQISEVINHEDELRLSMNVVARRSDLDVLLRADYLVANILHPLTRGQLVHGKLLQDFKKSEMRLSV